MAKKEEKETKTIKKSVNKSDSKNRSKKKKKKEIFSKFIILIGLIAIAVFTYFDFLCTKQGYPLSDSLVYSYFGFWTGEFFILGGIKKKKVLKYTTEGINYMDDDTDTSSSDSGDVGGSGSL